MLRNIKIANLASPHVCAFRPIIKFAPSATRGIKISSTPVKTFVPINTITKFQFPKRNFAYPNPYRPNPNQKKTTSQTGYYEPQRNVPPQQVQYEQNQMYGQQYYQPGQPGGTLMDQLSTDVGYRNFMKNVALTTATGLLSAALASAATIAFLPGMLGWGLALGAGLGGIGCLLGVSSMRPTFYQQHDGSVVALDPPARRALTWAFYGLEGVAMAPLLAKAALFVPSAIPIAGALTVATMAGMGLYAMYQPPGSLMRWSGPLFVALCGLIGVGILSLFVKSTALFWISALGGIGVFSAFTAMDFHQAQQMYISGQPDHTLASVNFFLDFTNLFQDFLRIIMMFNRDD